MHPNCLSETDRSLCRKPAMSDPSQSACSGSSRNSTMIAKAALCFGTSNPCCREERYCTDNGHRSITSSTTNHCYASNCKVGQIIVGRPRPSFRNASVVRTPVSALLLPGVLLGFICSCDSNVFVYLTCCRCCFCFHTIVERRIIKTTAEQSVHANVMSMHSSSTKANT